MLCQAKFLPESLTNTGWWLMAMANFTALSMWGAVGLKPRLKATAVATKPTYVGWVCREPQLSQEACARRSVRRG